MEIRNELRYLLSVGLWERMAADGLLTKEELARAKRLSAERYRPEMCIRDSLYICYITVIGHVVRISLCKIMILATKQCGKSLDDLNCFRSECSALC